MSVIENKKMLEVWMDRNVSQAVDIKLNPTEKDNIPYSYMATVKA